MTFMVTMISIEESDEEKAMRVSTIESMERRILVVPDVHGRTFWKIPVLKYKDKVDRIVFLGDYLDPYRDEGVEYDAEGILDNLMEIIELKQKNKDKVILLKGNHDQHYYSRKFNKLAGGTRQDKLRWENYHELFHQYKSLFQLAHLERVNNTPYLFSHAGITVYWLNKVNTRLWGLADNELSVVNQDIVDRINLLDDDGLGQELLAVIGQSRSWYGGEKTGGILWADIEDHPSILVPTAYGLNRVFQVFGHSRMRYDSNDMISFGNYAMIDSMQCFMIDESISQTIISIHKYEEISK